MGLETGGRRRRPVSAHKQKLPFIRSTVQRGLNFLLAWEVVHESQQQRRENRQRSQRDKTITINLGSSRRRSDSRLGGCRDWILLPGAEGEAGEGAGAGGAVGGWGLLGGWSIWPSSDGPPLRLQAGATAAGARYPLKSVIHCSLSRRKGRWVRGGGGWGATSVSLTPVVSQTNCSRWKHASKCFGLVSKRMRCLPGRRAFSDLLPPTPLLLAALPDIPPTPNPGVAQASAPCDSSSFFFFS